MAGFDLHRALLASCIAALLPSASSAIDVEWVTVGNPHNLCDTSNDCRGSVAYQYQISKYEITGSQWAEFLNAVASVADPHGLWDDNTGRSGSPGNYSYSGNAYPVHNISFHDAARFVNWMQNVEDGASPESADTESGSYTIDGSGTVERTVGASIFLPTAAEWYKAAYYDAGLDHYYTYPAQSDTEFTCSDPSPASHRGSCATDDEYPYIPGPQFVGSYTGSPSPWGTFDQGGNMFEWIEGPRIQGGGWLVNYHFTGKTQNGAGSASSGDPDQAGPDTGFRIVRTSPEPFDPTVNVPVEILVLSNRGDLLSGGDALVEVVVASPGTPETLSVELNGVDVTSQFGVRPNGRYMGVVTGLVDGPNLLTAVRANNGGGAQITLTNHPIEGPVFSGPHLTPWSCTRAGATLPDCNAPPVYSFHYQSVANPGVFEPYDTQNPPDPATVRQITTDHGKTVPYIVREEDGSMNRGVYSVAVLWDPSQPDYAPWAPQDGWNGKLFYPFGFSCGTNYNQGGEQTVLNDRALSQGFAVATSSLNELGHHCDTVKSAESVVMLKEHVIETLGEIRYTFGEGNSGGSIGQHQVANAYPGLLQGLIPGLTYPDVWTTAMDVADCYLLTEYYADSGAPLFASPTHRMAVEGHGTPTVCPAWVALFGSNIFPDSGCSAQGSPDYDPDTQPDGCRATVQDIQVNVWGRRPSDGFAWQPYSNEGVQYGLEALLAGDILAEQFVHLNENVGGADIDGNLVPQRNVMPSNIADIAYTAARVDDARGLAEVAIIDLPSPENVEIHTPYHAFSLEDRLVKANSHGDNHAIWRGGTIDGVAPAFDTMDAWLEAVEADSSGDPLADKVVNNRPLAADPVNNVAVAEDSCFISGQQVFDEAQCDVAWPYYASTRIAAGQDFAKDILQCQLKPFDEADYPPGTFTPDQVARLQAAFASGVCDWSVPGDGQTPSQTWVSYSGGPGGQPMGPAPVSMPEPGAMAMLGAGAALLAALRRRRAAGCRV